jgi:hypothetical protein
VTQVQLQYYRIVGGMASWKGKAPFHRASVVIVPNEGSGALVKVLRYGGSEAEGENLDADDWSALQRQGEAMAWPGRVPAQADVWLWVIRKTFALERTATLAELRQCCRLLGEPMEDSGDLACLVVEKKAADLREAWASRATRLAEDRLAAKKVNEALEAASTALQVGALMTPQRLALLALTYKRCGRDERSEGYFKMAERSLGAAFAREARKRFNELSRAYPVLSELSMRRVRSLRKSHLAPQQRAAA